MTESKKAFGFFCVNKFINKISLQCFCQQILVYLLFYYTTRCSGKIVFFTIHCNPSLAYIAVRDLQSSRRNASVQSLLLAGNFLYNQLQPSPGEGELANFREFLENNTIFNEHPVSSTAQNRATILSRLLSGKHLQP